jgi:hypothetical protein
MIIDRVLERQEPTLASLKNSRVVMGTGGLQSMEASTSNLARLPPAIMTPAHLDESQLLGVSLSSAARARFERLKHRIRLYALSEINECLDQKESLVMMNFNLIAIKEAFSVERLTEVTLLLAKITIMFMPVSLLSAYFGGEFVDAEFTVASYWKWFSGIFVASGVALVVFSAVSGTSKSKVLYKPVGTKIREKFIGLVKGKDRKRDFEDEENVF